LSLKSNSNDFINKYNICAHGFANGRNDNNIFRMTKQIARPYNSSYEFTNIGDQGKYYLTAQSIDGKDRIDFVNVITASSVQFIFDFANKARRKTTTQEWGGANNFAVDTNTYHYGKDFSAGDKVMLKTYGGTLGLPLPGAKVRLRVSKSLPNSVAGYTDKLMDQIKVVPNPYIISHQGQKSPYDSKIYFTKLPTKCTIEIYTIFGELVSTLHHDDSNVGENGIESVEIWDLLTSNKIKIQSQTLIAVIKTSDGAQTVKNFSVVVGNFRIN